MKVQHQRSRYTWIVCVLLTLCNRHMAHVHASLARVHATLNDRLANPDGFTFVYTRGVITIRYFFVCDEGSSYYSMFSWGLSHFCFLFLDMQQRASNLQRHLLFLPLECEPIFRGHQSFRPPLLPFSACPKEQQLFVKGRAEWGNNVTLQRNVVN